MENDYRRIKIIAITILIIGIYALTTQVWAAPTPYFLEIQSERIEVEGEVVGPEGLPLPGATVTIKGEKRGTTTNIEGLYSIIVEAEDTLVYSYLGFKTEVVPVNSRSEINIQLVEAISSLQAVEINAGYYNTTAREATGNISRVTAEEIEMQPVVSPLQALQGRMPGVEIIPNGNLPGSATTVRIRGINSLRAEGNYPLYIIDGVPVSSVPIGSFSNLIFSGIDPLNTLNLFNIKSIEVLKDADATAIYGSRGANGVILITTKKGRPGKTRLQTRVYTGASKVPNRVDLLNTQEYLQIRRRAFENDGIEPNKENAYDLVVWDQNRYTDWQELFFGGTSEVTDVNLNVSGGNENTTYRLSGSYHKQGTVFIGDYNYNKVTAGARLSHSSDNNKLNLDLSLNYGMDTHHLVGYLDLSSLAFSLPPNAPAIFNDNGNLNWDDWGEVGLNNPFEGFYNTSKTQSDNLISNLKVSYKISEELSFKTNFGYTDFNSNELVKRPKKSYNPAYWENYEHRSHHLKVNRNSWIIEPQLIFNSEIGQGELDIIIGSTFQQSTTDQLSLYGEGYVTESIIGNLNAAENIHSLSDSNSKYRYAAIFGRIGYNWKERYFINITGRRDGSSRFGPNKKFANFGAIGTAWIFSDEPFIKDSLPFLSFGKLRGSFGTTGNDQIGDYGYLDAYEATRGPGGLYPTQLSNPDYSWEVNKKLEAAIELGLFKDRFFLSVSWYRNRSSNQLVGYPLPATTGFSSVQANLPATVENKGFEIEVSTLNIQAKDFEWQTFFNLSLPDNELISYPNLDQSSYSNTYRVGHPLNIELLYNYAGLDPETGFYTIGDINKDGRFDYQDQEFIWERGREFYGGIGNNITYRNFSLSFLFDFVKQEGELNLFKAGEFGNQRQEVIKALGVNDEFQTISQSIPFSRAYSYAIRSNLPIVDASYVRLRTISLVYSLPYNLLQSIGIDQGSIFLNGQNLFTLTNYKGIDPVSPYGGTNFTQLRTITGGLQFKF